jgi:FAD/FMN-containing dehydrogenase
MNHALPATAIDDAQAQRLLGDLRAALGDDAVISGAAVGERTVGIWSRRPLSALAIVRPRSTAEMATAMRLCHAVGQPMVAQGGRTGLTESHHTRAHEIVLSLERMNQVEEIDPVDRTMVVQAGAILETLQNAADDAGLLLPLDLGGRGSCTIGGNISTNAGGNRVIRYGMTRESVLGLEVVLADGTVLSSMNRMIKNNAGYDLKQLFIGTEGTLGIVTRAVLRLREKPRSQGTVLVALPDFASVTALLKRADGELGGMLSAYEVLWNDFYRLTTTAPAPHTPPLPQDYPFYALIETMGGDPETDRARIEALLGSALEDGLVLDAVLAENEAQRRSIWAIRDDVGQANRFVPMVAFDVSLRISAMDAYVQQVKANMAARFPNGHHLFTFGHIADGNIHFAISVGDGSAEARRGIEAAVYEPLPAIGGSVSAEHGIGLEKKPYLPLCRSEAEFATMRLMKRALDPRGLLNAGKIFDL